MINRNILVLTMCMLSSMHAVFAQVERPVSSTLMSINNGHQIDNSGVYTITEPLFNIRSGILNYPLAASYKTRAFQVQELASPIGLGWDMIGISGIFRDIKGNPDTFQGNTDSDKDIFNVTIGSIQLKIVFSNTGQPLVLNNQPFVVKKFPENNSDYWTLVDDKGVEYIFGNYSNARETITFTDKNVVDSLIDRRAPQNRDLPLSGYPSWFGPMFGDSVRFERNIINYQNVPITWYLTKIIDPNQVSSIDFTYQKNSNPVDLDYYNIVYTLSTLIQSKYRSGLHILGIPLIKPKISTTNTYTKSRFFVTSNSRINNSLLTEILATDCHVKFEYSDREDLIYGKKIDRIILKSQNDTIKTYRFDYFYTDSYNQNQDPIHNLSFDSFLDTQKKQAEAKRLMLHKIVLNNSITIIENKYNTSDILPTRYTQHTDDFGYYRINNKSHDVMDEKYLPSFHQDTSSYYSPYMSGFYSSGKKPVLQQTKANTLEYIIKPTGGKVLFNYEANKVLIDSVEQMVAGGVRVKTVIYDYHTVKDTIRYEYSQNFNYKILPSYKRSLSYRGELFSPMGSFDGRPLTSFNEIEGQLNQIGSKNMMVYDRFGIGNAQMHQNSNIPAMVNTAYGIYKGLQWNPMMPLYEATLLSTNSVHKSFVDQTPCYEQIKIIEPNKGYTIRNYTGYWDYPDNINVAYLKKAGNADRISITNDNIFRGTTDFSSLRNNLIMERKFDSSHRLLSKDGYKYKIILLDSASGTYIEPINYEGPINHTVTKHYHYKIYDFFHRIDSVKNTLYSYDNTTDSINSYTNFVYSSQYPYLITSQSSQDVDGRQLRSTITYPFSSTSYNFSSEMQAKNMINYPIESVYYRDSDVIGGFFFEYDKSNNILFNNKIYKLSLDQPVSQNLFTSSILGSKDQRYKLELQTSAIDQYGNSLEFRTPGGQVVTNLWGYKNQYPIAKITNATYNDVIATLGVNASSILSQFGQLDVSESYIRENVDFIRNNLSDALVETYTYKPYTGLTSRTDTRGIVEYYEYDSFSRLQAIKDDEGNLLQTYCYNYAGQQSDCLKYYYRSKAIDTILYNVNCLNPIPYHVYLPEGFYTDSATYDIQWIVDEAAFLYAYDLTNQYGQCGGSIQALEMYPDHSGILTIEVQGPSSPGLTYNYGMRTRFNESQGPWTDIPMGAISSGQVDYTSAGFGAPYNTLVEYFLYMSDDLGNIVYSTDTLYIVSAPDNNAGGCLIVGGSYPAAYHQGAELVCKSFGVNGYIGYDLKVTFKLWANNDGIGNSGSKYILCSGGYFETATQVGGFCTNGLGVKDQKVGNYTLPLGSQYTYSFEIVSVEVVGDPNVHVCHQWNY